MLTIGTPKVSTSKVSYNHIQSKLKRQATTTKNSKTRQITFEDNELTGLTSINDVDILPVNYSTQ